MANIIESLIEDANDKLDKEIDEGQEFIADVQEDGYVDAVFDEAVEQVEETATGKDSAEDDSGNEEEPDGVDKETVLIGVVFILVAYIIANR